MNRSKLCVKKFRAQVESGVSLFDMYEVLDGYAEVSRRSARVPCRV